MGPLKINHKIGPVGEDLDINYHPENLFQVYFNCDLIMIHNHFYTGFKKQTFLKEDITNSFMR